LLEIHDNVFFIRAATRLGNDLGNIGLGSNRNPFGTVAVYDFDDDLAKVILDD
jgi:hypothetical protein